MAFFEVRLPVDVSLGFSGGPQRRTEVIALASGREERNQRWAGSRRAWNAAYGVRRLDQLHAVLDFFEMAAGRMHGFRVRDWTDWKSCQPQKTPTALDQWLGDGDGAATQFQLGKRYGVAGFRTWRRSIIKPVAETVRIAVDGVEIGGGWSVNPTNGVVTFDAAPAPGAALSAGFAFDAPARFDTDTLLIDAAMFDTETGRALGEIADVPLIEDLNAMSTITADMADLTAAIQSAIVAASAETSGPAGRVEPVTPSDAADLPQGPARSFYVTGAGVVMFHDHLGQARELVSGDNQYHPLRIRRVLATGTTATGILALY